MPVTGGQNVGVAFGAVIAAGASTAVGAAIVFFPRLVKLASRRVLASSLGISAGVMTYVSFVEIFQKAQGSFNDHLERDYEDENKRFGMANLYATLSFFLGVLCMVVSKVIASVLCFGVVLFWFGFVLYFFINCPVGVFCYITRPHHT